MFLKFYGLKEQPFGVTPDPRFLYLSPSHREAIASLYCAIENGRGFSVMIAKPGMGKTSILFRLLETLKSRARTAFLFQSDCDSRQLFQSLLLDLGLEPTDDIVRMRESLNRLLLEERGAGRRFVVVLDEAQNLSVEVLESIRLLSNFETPTEKLLHIVLAGQPQLATTLAIPEMAQLTQRVSATIRLAPLSLEETRTYIHHRLSRAGHKGSEVFTDDAYILIAQLSEGIPRNISNICFQALSVGCALRSSKIHPGIVAEVANDLCAAGVEVPGQPVSLGVPSTARSWNFPEAPLVSRTPLGVAPLRLRLWRFGLATSVLGLVSFFAWQTVGARWKLEWKLKSEAIRPEADSGISPAGATRKPAAMDSSVTAANTVSPDPAAPGAVDGSDNPIEPIETPAPFENRTAAEVKPARQPRTILAVPASRSRERQGQLRLANIARRGSFPRVIYIERSQSLFQVALENYGRSSRELVYRIQVANPSLKDPDVVLWKGQRLVLPDVPASDLGGKEN
jgi:type II secretory pathway predicted ATPase ExeA/phage tail protein X